MAEPNNPESNDELAGQGDGSDGPASTPPAPASEAPPAIAASGEAAKASGEAAKKSPLTPGQRLAAKKAQKAVDKRDAKEERRREEEEKRLAEQEEADRLFGRGTPASTELPAEVERAASGFTDFVQDNRGRFGMLALAAVVIGLGAFGVRHFMRSGATEEAKLLTRALELSNAPIDPDDADGVTDDGEPLFKSEQARAEKALAAFDQVSREGDGLAATWARLGGGAALVQLGKFDEARSRFQAIYQANAKQPALAARALEGEAVALEASGKIDEALAKYQQLQKVDGAKELAQYHEARLKLQKGDLEGGKTQLKALYDQLSAPAEGGSTNRYLRSEVEVRLSEIDSSLVDRGSSMGGGSAQQFSEEQIQRMIEQLQRQQQQQGQ